MIVDPEGREVAFLGVSGGIPRLLKSEQARCIITPDGLATFDADDGRIIELVTAYDFPSGIEEELVSLPSVLTPALDAELTEEEL